MNPAPSKYSLRLCNIEGKGEEKENKNIMNKGEGAG
jgi:hypothetical protein